MSKGKKDNWTDHCKEIKKFVHKDIFDNSGQHLDFILGLDPRLVYYVSQFWDQVKIQQTRKSTDGKQFLFYWNEIELFCYGNRHDRLHEIIKTANKWKKVVYTYQPDLEKKQQEALKRERERKSRHERMLDKIYPDLSHYDDTELSGSPYKDFDIRDPDKP